MGGKIFFLFDRMVLIMKIAIQGIAGSFHHEAANHFFKNEKIDLIGCDDFKTVFEQLKENNADYGVVAIENTNFGSINEVYDLLEKYNKKLKIINELPLKISQQLITNKTARVSDIKVVYSHPVALGQCSKFLQQNLPNAKLVVSVDTAASVKDLEIMPEVCAAIGSKTAAKLYGRKIIARNIENNHNNYTRFLLIVKKSLNNIIGANKYSVVVDLTHEKGSLARLLSDMSERGFNLTKIQSRPYENKPWQYKFYIDFIDTLAKDNLEELFEKNHAKYKILGLYPAIIG
jgi:prephenate dehydratase